MIVAKAMRYGIYKIIYQPTTPDPSIIPFKSNII